MRTNALLAIAIETLPSIVPSVNTTIWSGDFGWLADDLYTHFNVPQTSEKQPLDKEDFSVILKTAF